MLSSTNSIFEKLQKAPSEGAAPVSAIPPIFIQHWSGIVKVAISL